ncbi:uncharacterized protein LOC118469644 [Amphiprion ocellaris]|uniref:uncharacterized protein LOC118469644 n=1 Tax=Amphiprion ocellaris TaxID=80972 RepID=UPI00164990BC|nr:uncharacterized protein LOC118469644 [Amphiprion ocellaris]
MTTVTFVFLTLFTWLASSGTWLSQCGHHEETASRSASCKNAVIHISDKTNLTRNRYSEMSIAFEEFSCMCFNGCPNLFKRVTVNAEKENWHVCKCTVQPFLVLFLSKTSGLLLTIETKYHNQSTDLSYRTICTSCLLLRSVADCAHIITPVLVYNKKTMDYFCICEVCDLEVKILQGFVHRGPRCGFSECLIFILSHIQVSSEGKRAYISIFCVKIPSSSAQCTKEAFLTPADGIKFPACRGRMKSVQPTDSSRWTGRCFLLAVLVLAVYTTRIKISSNRVSPVRDNNSTIVRLFAVTLSCFSPSLSIYQLSEFSIITVSLCCTLGRTVHVLIACKAAHTVMKHFSPAQQQQFIALPVTALCLWMTLCGSFSNKNMNYFSTDVLAEDNVGSALRSWAVSGHVQLLVTLCCVFVSLPSLLQSILTKLNILNIVFHLQLVMCLQNSRIPTKYVLVIKISGLIQSFPLYH